MKRKRPLRRPTLQEETYCESCGNYGYGYMLDHDLWKEVSRGQRFLCMLCVEDRLGRPLRTEDFDFMWAINQPILYAVDIGVRSRGRQFARKNEVKTRRRARRREIGRCK